jgi:hypothetical protein
VHHAAVTGRPRVVVGIESVLVLQREKLRRVLSAAHCRAGRRSTGRNAPTPVPRTRAPVVRPPAVTPISSALTMPSTSRACDVVAVVLRRPRRLRR